jgi:hypothetical protein
LVRKNSFLFFRTIALPSSDRTEAEIMNSDVKDKVPPSPLEAEAGQDTASPLHDQWLLDEALAETFPASDPISPSGLRRAS